MRSSDGARSRRVLYLVTSDISARFLRGQLAYLIEHDFHVSVATRLSDPPATFDDGVEVHDLRFEREPNPLTDAKGVLATIRLIRDLRPDIVNASTPKAGLLGMLAAKCCRVQRRIYVVRGLRFETMTGPRRGVFTALERLATACATDVVYNSRSLLEMAESEGAVRRGRGVVLGAGSGNGIDVRRFDDLPTPRAARDALGLDPDAQVVGFVGRLTVDKGVVDLVDAYGNSGHGTTVLLVGDLEPGDPVPESTRRLIESGRQFVHIPWVEDTRNVYRAMDVLAFPSYREGLPNVPLEAQLCGVPVVAYAATGTIDALEDGIGGVLVPLADTAELKSAIDDLLATPERSSAMAENGRRWVIQNFDQQRVWEALVALYRESEGR